MRPCLTLALTILFCFALGIRNKPAVATFGSRKHKFVGFARVIAWVAVALTNFELISFFDTLIQDIVATSAFWVQYVVVLGHPQLLLILFPGFLAWRLLKKCKDIFNPTLVAWN